MLSRDRVHVSPSQRQFSPDSGLDFWRHAVAIQGSITPHVMPNVLWMGAIASITTLVIVLVERYFHLRLVLAIAPYELIGAALGLVLVLRTNSGYDRWWEARKLWGGIVNQSRNLVIGALSYGPSDQVWRKQFVDLSIAFGHAARLSLRGQSPDRSLLSVLGEAASSILAKADHMPSLIALELARLLNEALKSHGMNSIAFSQIDKERALLIDHLGGCERIRKTPLALAYSIKIRRFIASFLLTLPFALVEPLQSPWLVPAVTMLVAYPLLSLDQLGVELQNPFSEENLSHLPLDEICSTIEGNLRDLSEDRSDKFSSLILQSKLPQSSEPDSPPPQVDSLTSFMCSNTLT